MGHGTSKSYFVQQERIPTLRIPVSDLMNRVKVYQDSSGEVIIAFDEDAKKVIGNMEGWELCNYHKNQRNYYNNLIEKTQDEVAEVSESTMGMKSDSSVVPVESLFKPKYSNEMKTSQASKGNKKDRNYNDDSDERLKVVIEEKKDNSGSPMAVKYTPKPYSAPSSTLIHNDLTYDASIQNILSGKKKSNSQSDASYDECKSFDCENFSIQRSRPHARFPLRCNVCNESFKEIDQEDVVREHLETCAETIAIRKELSSIDDIIRPVSNLIRIILYY